MCRDEVKILSMTCQINYEYPNSNSNVNEKLKHQSRGEIKKKDDTKIKIQN